MIRILKKEKHKKALVLENLTIHKIIKDVNLLIINNLKYHHYQYKEMIKIQNYGIVYLLNRIIKKHRKSLFLYVKNHIM